MTELEKCINPECEETKIRCKGMCANCYRRFQRKGTYARDRIIGNKACKFCGTTDSYGGWRQGYCTACYGRYKSTGSLEYVYGKQIRGTEFCVDCGSTDPKAKYWQLGRCSKCYAEYYRRLHNKQERVFVNNCIDCGRENKKDGSYKDGQFTKSRCQPCYQKWKNETNVSHKIHGRISGQIRGKLKGRRKAKRTEVYLGCTYEELIERLESQFDENMSWENYGKYWHIDHIIPTSYFNLENDGEISYCWNYRNLRPLEAKENIVKNDILPNGKSARFEEKDGVGLFIQTFGDIL